MVIEETDAFEMKCNFGFRGETLGQWWQKQLTVDKTELWENWFKVYIESFLPGVFELIGRYGPKLLFRQRRMPKLSSFLKKWQARLTQCWQSRKEMIEESQPMRQKSFAQYSVNRVDQ
ncbi:hypothetical protein [Pseudoramibacter faecis]|uniref:hypothetical protein n=1 Tax=Pseudoramibacter faecis TaxID=3108534 RepID=UPI002E781D69|nr:hypothetical protein [Pseudoramibacter sp. HA2172]